jgi:hypothetical protein
MTQFGRSGIMDENATAKPGWGFWAIGVLGLVWNVMGVANLAMQMNPANLENMPELHQAIAQSRPDWATAAFAIAVVGGALGCGLLLLRRKLALPLFVVSLLAMVAHMFSYAALANPNVVFGWGDIALIVVMPIAVAAFLIRYAMRCRNMAWLK